MRVISTILLLVSIQLLIANPNIEIANDAYNNGDFETAIEAYKTVLEKGEFPDVHYNLGNSYYKVGYIAEAILQYEKALVHQPNNKDILYNLEMANLQIVDKIEVSPEFFLLTWWKQLAKQQTANKWTVAFLILFWLSIILFIGYVFTSGKSKRLFFFSAFFGIIGAIFILFLAITKHNLEVNHQYAIVMSPSISIKSEPLNTGTDLFIIHEGLKVKVLESTADWANVKLADGKEGWLKKEMLEEI